MKVYEQILKSFSNDYKLLSVSENFVNLSIRANISSFILQEVSFNNFLSKTSHRDKVRLRIYEDGYDVEILSYSTGTNVDEFMNDFNSNINSNSNNYILNIEIVKEISINTLSIYGFDEFSKYISSLTLKGVLAEFNKILVDKFIFLELQEDTVSCNSSSIHIMHRDTYTSGMYSEIGEKREERIRKRIRICNFLNVNDYKLIPDDFSFNNCEYPEFKKAMTKLEIILSIISISDIAEIIGDNRVRVVINGYKRIDCIIEYDKMGYEDLIEYIDIYNWVFSEGDISDKAGIARNVISLSVKDIVTDINSELMPSIKSSHEIYLKENVSKYLEVKSKVTEFLFNITQKATELSSNIGKALLNNLIAVITFYSTIVIMNILSEKKLENIFTKDITIISFIFWITSIGYMIISIHETKVEVKRYKDTYDRVKNSYDDILNKEDIISIFKNDEYLKNDIEYIKTRVKSYLIFWVMILLISIIFLCIYGTWK
ncbi:hypothetical protein [Clostridium algidicarnis]|uniref:hypothetical protein n=1 Tax=Clostridium algidicarnis TaxID=37659 RepID=UPI001627A122|nr:hypothetical protein [Clostridium algidicarnis]MBB6696234.1 hypothetical protein [Clostridium algidicarnis]